MKLEIGQTVKLNRSMGQCKKGEIFKVIRISGLLAVIKSIITNDEYFVYRNFSGVDLIEKEIFHV